jgi:protease-4
VNGAATPPGRKNYLTGCMMFAAVTFALIAVLAVAMWGLQKQTMFMPGLGKRIAVVEIKGEIQDSRDVVDELDDYGEDNSIRAVVLRIDSPGGGVAASQEIYEAVRRLRAHKKPVVVSMGTFCASGGYYVACAADTLVANPGTITASIGVIMEIPTAAELMKKLGVKWEVIRSGKAKGAGVTWKDMSADERASLQGLIDDSYDQFVDAVASERGMERKDVLAIADGRALTGQQALRVGLVDKLGDLKEAEDVAAGMAGIVGKPVLARHRDEEPGIWDLVRKVANQKWSGPGLLDPSPRVRLEYRVF